LLKKLIVIISYNVVILVFIQKLLTWIISSSDDSPFLYCRLPLCSRGVPSPADYGVSGTHELPNGVRDGGPIETNLVHSTAVSIYMNDNYFDYSEVHGSN